MKRVLLNNYLYGIIFIFSFLCLTIFCFPNLYGDPLANYGFSYAILRGEIPYLDFNIISTPLYSYMMAFGLIFWNNITMFLIEQAFLITILFYFLKESYGKRAFILIFFYVLFLGLGMNATYNFCAFFFLCFLLYLEKKYPDKDYLIGIVLGFCVLSKHTVGGLLIFPCLLFYFKDKKKVWRRFIGLAGVGACFLLYLLLMGNFFSFFDLCLFGLFDFTSNNGHLFNFWFFASIVCFIFSIYLTFRNKYDIRNWYLLCGISFVIPLFDLCHFSLYIICIIIQLLPYFSFLKRENYIIFLSFILSLTYGVMLFIGYNNHYRELSFNKNINHFQYILNNKAAYIISTDNYYFFDSYPDALILSNGKMMYDISRNRDIDYFDVFLYGNHGYHGSEKLISIIDGMHNKYIIVEISGYENLNSDSQYNREVAKYVMDTCERVDSYRDFGIYYKK